MARKSIFSTRNLLLLLSTIIIVVIWVFQWGILKSGSYAIHQEDLYRIDTVHLQDGAAIKDFESPSSRSITFEDDHNKTFTLSGPANAALAQFSHLPGMLQKGHITLSVYTDKRGYEQYLDQKNSEKIRVFNIQVADTSYIDLKDLNREAHKKHVSYLLFFSIAYCIHLVLYFAYKRKRDEGVTDLL